jgi:hypothetical protein
VSKLHQNRPALERVVNVDRMIVRLDTIASAQPKDDACGIIRDFKQGLKTAWPFASEEDDAG